MTTCRLVDLSTCRPSPIVNNIDPVRVRVRVRLGLGLGSGLVWVRVRIGLGLGLTVDIQIRTIMTINEDPSPNLIGRQIDRSTSRRVDKSTIQFWQYR